MDTSQCSGTRVCQLEGTVGTSPKTSVEISFRDFVEFVRCNAYKQATMLLPAVAKLEMSVWSSSASSPSTDKARPLVSSVELWVTEQSSFTLSLNRISIGNPIKKNNSFKKNVFQFFSLSYSIYFFALIQTYIN
jgi:hypothetical protein